MAKSKTSDEAYFSSTFLNGLSPHDPHIFKIALIAYDKIYVDKDISNLPWAHSWDGIKKLQAETKKLQERINRLERIATNFNIRDAAAELFDIISMTASGRFKKRTPKKESSSPETAKVRIDISKLEKSQGWKTDPPVISPLLYYSNDIDETVFNGVPSTDTASVALANYIQNEEILKGLAKRNSLQYIRNHPNNAVKNFFKMSFEDEISSGLTPVFHRKLFDLIAVHLLSSKGIDTIKDPFNRDYLTIMMQEIFVTHYLSKKHNISPILTTSDLDLRLLLDSAFHSMEIVPDEMEKPYLYFDYFSDIRTLHNLVSERQEVHEKVDVIMNMVAPNFSLIPLKEIVHLKTKDKFESLQNLAKRLTNTKSLSDEDIAKYFIDELWKMGKRLSPSISEIMVGILGEVPLPIPVNPIGILSSLHSIKGLLEFKKEYGWFIVLSKFRDRQDHSKLS